MSRDYAGVAASCMTDEAILTALRETEQRRRIDYARELALLTELQTRDTAARHGYSDVAALAREVLRVDPHEARRRVTHARTLVAEHTPTGLPLDPELPEVGAALAEGLLDPARVEAIRATVARFPRPLNPPDAEAAQRLLIKAALEYEPRTVTRLGKEILARLDQDGAPPNEADLADPHRVLDLQEDKKGRLRGSFVLDPETGTLLAELLEPHAKKRTGEEGPDRRSKDERQGDALAEIVRIAAGCPDQGPTEAGEPFTVMVGIDYDHLATNTGYGMLNWSLPISASQVRRIACDAKIIPVTLGRRREVLDIGRKSRVIPIGLRRALIFRDRGCAFPGCRRKPKHCDGHHVCHWIDHGPTALHNLVLLCRFHHRLIHHGDWQVRMHNGLPEFIPPAYLDPLRTPRRNLLHQA